MNAVDLVTAAVFLGALTCAACLVMAFGGGAARRNQKRIDTVRRRWSATAQREALADSLLQSDDDGRLGSMALRLMPRRHMLRQRLMKAGLTLSPGQYSLICIAVCGIGMLIVKFLFGLSLIVAALVGIVIGVGLPHWLVSWLADRRLRKFTKLFPEAIDLMVRGIKSGLPISETIGSIGEEMVDPVGIEFRRITDSVKLGQTLEEALWDAARRLDTADFKFFVISLSVQRETGGNLGETLENLADVLRRRQQLFLKIKAMSSEARASAYIIGSLPFVMLGILMMLNRGYVMPLFTDSRGLIITGIGLFMITLGAMVMSKMIKFDV